MYTYHKNKKDYISKEALEGSQVLDVLKEACYYYEYENDNVKSHLHIISDLNFLQTHEETVGGVFSASGEKIQVVGVNKAQGPNLGLGPIKKTNRVHILGLGDVGGMLLTGLRLMGAGVISEIGIFDLDPHKVQRYEYEMNQIKACDDNSYPRVVAINQEALFQCDVFVFTASKGIPPVGSKVKDVRMYQLENNTKIINHYVDQAVKAGFKGLFAVVSDPVDLLCERVLHRSQGGLKPEQVKGFGLGVMAARASYYASQAGLKTFEEEGTAFGPHGKSLIVANSLIDYDHDLSMVLTKKTVEANLDVRAVGYKPFIAPALSSGALSLIDCMRGRSHYSTIYINGVYYGCKNKQVGHLLFQPNQYPLPPLLLDRMEATYKELKAFES